MMISTAYPVTPSCYLFYYWKSAQEHFPRCRTLATRLCRVLFITALDDQHTGEHPVVAICEVKTFATHTTPTTWYYYILLRITTNNHQNTAQLSIHASLLQNYNLRPYHTPTLRNSNTRKSFPKPPMQAPHLLPRRSDRSWGRQPDSFPQAPCKILAPF